MKSCSNYLTLTVITGVVLTIDQLTKFYIDSSMPLYTSITIAENFF